MQKIEKSIVTKGTKKTFRHLLDEDIHSIEAYIKRGLSNTEIAHILQVHKSTITKIIQSDTTHRHLFNACDCIAARKKKRKGSKCPAMKLDKYPEIIKKIYHSLQDGASPQSIALTSRKEGWLISVSAPLIYRWIYHTPEGKTCTRFLCEGRRRYRYKRTETTRYSIPNRRRDSERNKDNTSLHGEADCFVSPRRSHDKTVGILATHITVKLLSGSILSTKKHLRVIPAMQACTQMLKVTTYTLDNGVENIAHEQFGAQCYFARRGMPSDKPHIECSIGLIRRHFLPKGTVLKYVSNETFQMILIFINHIPRLSLKGMSAYEAAKERGIIDMIPSPVSKRVILERLAMRV